MRNQRRRRRKYCINYIGLITRILLAVLGIAVLAGGVYLLFAPHETVIEYQASTSIQEDCAETQVTKLYSPVRFMASDEPMEQLPLLVNWENPVPYDKPPNLVTQSQIFADEVLLVNGEGQIDAEAAQAARQMFLAARADGIGRYRLSSAYRSISYQEGLWQARLKTDPWYGYNPYETPVKVMPGECSEHTTGLALDILSEKYQTADDGYGQTEEGRWLAEHAHEYGFILRYPKEKEHITGVIYEPWHYRYVGKKHAALIYESGLCLEEYLKRQEDR